MDGAGAGWTGSLAGRTVLVTGGNVVLTLPAAAYEMVATGGGYTTF